MSDTALQVLLDKDAIRDVISRFCRGCDRRDAEMMASCYHPEAIDDHGMYYGPGVQFFEANEEVDAQVRALHHNLGQSIIEVEGDVAAAETYAIATIDGLPGSEETVLLNVRYVDRFERRDGEWRIAHRFVAFDSEMRVAGGVPSFIPEKNHGRRDREDASHAVFAAVRAQPLAG
jgi:ketosteroid isomerase-like protein